MSAFHQYNTKGMSLAGNVGVAVKNVFPRSVELKIYYMLCIIHKLYLLLQVLSRHFGHLVGARLVLFSSPCSPIIFRKSHSSVSVYSQWLYEIASKIVAWGYFYPPPPISTKKVNSFLYAFDYCVWFLLLLICSVSLCVDGIKRYV